MKLGAYPGLSLAKARKRAKDVLTAAHAGEDPAQKRQDNRSDDRSFRALADEVLNAKEGKVRPKTVREYRCILQSNLLPAWGHRPASAVSRRDVVRLVEGIAEEHPAWANHTLVLVRIIFNEGLRREFPGLESNPAHMLTPPGRVEPRRRFLDRDEIQTVWKAIAKEKPIMRTIFQLTLLTAQRVGSVCALRWADVDDTDVWTIPADTFKGKRPHAVPLSSEARHVLEELPRVDDVFAFPSARSDATEPHITSTNKALQRIRKRTGLPRWTVHDFRRTFRTHATRAAEPGNPKDPAGLGVAPHIADAVLGHKEASLGFDRYTGEPERYLLAEKRMALEAWGAFVMKAVVERGG
jgi:integrase